MSDDFAYTSRDVVRRFEDGKALSSLISTIARLAKLINLLSREKERYAK